MSLSAAESPGRNLHGSRGSSAPLFARPPASPFPSSASAIGKKNWLFIGDGQAGQRCTILCTVIESCRRRGLDPFTYLREVFTRLPSMTNWPVNEPPHKPGPGRAAQPYPPVHGFQSHRGSEIYDPNASSRRTAEGAGADAYEAWAKTLKIALS